VLPQNDYLVLSPSCFLKSLEEPCVYNIETDELYETNAEAFNFLKLCDGSNMVRDLVFESYFVDWCLEEKILITNKNSTKREFILEQAPIPSLRYLEIQLTARCNLQCRHCYLGPARVHNIPMEQIMASIQQFEQIQGLRLLISGGEPLLHPDFWTLNDKITDFGFRSILLSNGFLIDRITAKRLRVHEVQISLDGVDRSHDFIRGRGSFKKAIRAIRELRSLGKDVSVATMVHTQNITDFPRLQELVMSMGIKEWNVDVPCIAGNLIKDSDIQLPYKKSAPFLKYGFGGGLYHSSPGYSCGTHLCTITPQGEIAKCGFFSNTPVGHIKEGLQNCWKRINHIKLEELECSCQYKEECRGGCRFRAYVEKDIYAPDPVQCYIRGVLPVD